jgi:hypothetical protein
MMAFNQQISPKFLTNSLLTSLLIASARKVNVRWVSSADSAPADSMLLRTSPGHPTQIHTIPVITKSVSQRANYVLKLQTVLDDKS